MTLRFLAADTRALVIDIPTPLTGPVPHGCNIHIISATGFSTTDLRLLQFKTDFYATVTSGTGAPYTPNSFSSEVIIPEAVFAKGTTVGVEWGPDVGHVYIKEGEYVPAITVYDRGVATTFSLAMGSFRDDGGDLIGTSITVQNALTYLQATHDRIYFFSRSGFTGVPLAASAQVIHVDIPDGIFNPNTYFNVSQKRALFFKAGETFYPTTFMDTGDEGWFGPWDSTGIMPTTNAIMDVFTENTDAGARGWWIRNKDVAKTKIRQYGFDVLCGGATGYDPRADNEWWNTLPVSGVSGTFTERTNLWEEDPVTSATTGSNQPSNGEIVRGRNSGAEAVLIGLNDGALDVEEVTNGPFQNGEIIDGVDSGASATFSSTGARQEATLPKQLMTGVEFGEQGALTFANHVVYRMKFSSAGFAGVYRSAKDSTLCDIEVDGYFNYALSEVASQSVLIAVVAGNPIDDGSLIPPTDLSVAQNSTSPNRNEWNTVIVDDPSIPARNGVRHTVIRSSEMGRTALLKCALGTYGGGHEGYQPTFRVAVVDDIERIRLNIQGSAFWGNKTILNFDNGGTGADHLAPQHIVLDANCLMAIDEADGEFINCKRMNFVFSNNLFLIASGRTITGFSNNTPINFESYVPLASGKTYDSTGQLAGFIENNTFAFVGTITSGGDLLQPVTSNGESHTYRNNILLTDPTDWSSVAAAWSSINDWSNLASYGTTDFKPTSGATGAYQTATGSYPRFDAKGVAKPLTNASKGWLEP